MTWFTIIITINTKRVINGSQCTTLSPHRNTELMIMLIFVINKIVLKHSAILGTDYYYIHLMASFQDNLGKRAPER